jgi:ParB/RepB/Spo0J family partition protein
MTATATPAHDQILTVPIALLDESPTNTRRTWGNLDELATSFREVGILQPLVARAKGARFELVFGHRRLRAAKKAKLDVVPVIVRTMTDAIAHEAQVVENLQRTDLHPLEEAEGFEQLHALGWSADDMAGKIGKSRAYVFERMKLLELSKALREAFYKDAFGASIALYLARLPGEKLQLEAYKAIQTPKYEQQQDGEGPVVSARRALKIIQDEFMLRLDQASFDRGDINLVPAAGSCKDCPKRTGNQAELFADVASKDVCTDPPCFQSKVKAHIAQARFELEAKGVEVLAGQKHDYGDMSPPAGFEKLASTFLDWQGAQKWRGKGYGAIIKAAGLSGERERTVMIDEKGRAVELVKKSLVSKALSKVGAKKKDRPAPSRKLSAKEQAKLEQTKARRELVKSVGKKAIAQILAKVKTAGTPSTETWRLVARGLACMFGGYQAKKELAHIEKASVEQLVAIVLEDLLRDDYEGELLFAAAEHYGVDLESAAAAPPAPKKAKGKKSAGKK